MIHQKKVILGAGLAGLSASHHLNEESFIYEMKSKIGGLACTEKIDGFSFDFGPHILYTIDPYASEFIQKLLEGNLLIKQRKAYVYHGKYDLYTRFPFQAHLYGLPTSIILECLEGLVRELKNNHKPKPQNYHEWLYRRFGKGISEHLMIPYSEKIWTVSPSRMNYDWIDRRVPVLDFELILEGALTDIPKRRGFNNDFWYPLYGGMESLPVALAENVKNINLNMEATDISPKGKQVEFNGEIRVEYEHLISTLPLPVIINLIKDAPTHIKKAAQDLEHNSILCVNLGIDRPNISPDHWLYFHEDDFIFHRISFPMNLSDKTTPRGKSSVSCEIAHSKYRPIDTEKRDDIIKRTIQDLVKAKILKEDDKILVSGVAPLKYGYVIYDLNHRKNVNQIHSYLHSLDIYPCGRFGEWEYFNMDHSILSGKRTADKLNKLCL